MFRLQTLFQIREDPMKNMQDYRNPNLAEINEKPNLMGIQNEPGKENHLRTNDDIAHKRHENCPAARVQKKQKYPHKRTKRPVPGLAQEMPDVHQLFIR